MSETTPGPPGLLVTGAAGFIGARLVEAFQEQGRSAYCVDRLAHFDERPEHRGFPFGPRVDRDRLFEWLEEERPSLRGIVHLGACTDTTERDEDLFERLNLDYSRRIWEYASRHRVPLVYASSAATYGDGSAGYDDDEAKIPTLRPLNPYGESKQRFDLWALSREKEGVSPPAWSGFKFFNVYGFGERHKGNMASVVLKAADQIRSTGKVRLFRSHHPDFGDGEQSRDFVSVEDVVEVLRFALDRPISRGIYNVGTGTARTFLDLVRAVFDVLGAEERIEFIDTPASIRDQYQYYTRATMERLAVEGYEGPLTPLEDGVRRYLERLLRLESGATRTRG